MNNPGPAYIIANGHCVVAMPSMPVASEMLIPNDNSQHIVVRESIDGISWHTTFVSHRLNGVPQHDSYMPWLSRNVYNTGDHHVLLTFYTTIGDGSTPGAKWNVHGISNNMDGAVFPTGWESSGTSTSIWSMANFDVPLKPLFGDYSGSHVALNATGIPTTNDRYFFAYAVRHASGGRALYYNFVTPAP